MLMILKGVFRPTERGKLKKNKVLDISPKNANFATF